MPDGAAGGSPWAADGPAGAWWRGDPAAAAARFAGLRPAVPPVPPAPVVTLPPPPEPAPLEAAVPPVDAALSPADAGPSPVDAGPSPVDAAPSAADAPPTPAKAALSPADAAPTLADAALSPAGEGDERQRRDVGDATITAAEQPAGVDVPEAEREPDSTAGPVDAASDDTPDGTADGAEDGPARAFAAPARNLATEPESAAPGGVTSPPEEAAEEDAPPAAGSLPPDDGVSTREDDGGSAPGDDGAGEQTPPAAARSEPRPSDAAGSSPDEEGTDEDAPLAAATAGGGAPEDEGTPHAAAEPAEVGDLTPDLAVPAPEEEASHTDRLRAAAPDLTPPAPEPETPLAVEPEHATLADLDRETAPALTPEAEPIDDTQDHRLWRATSRQRPPAEAAEPAWAEEEDAGALHTRATVVLPPMPDRALIPTPSPAPVDEDLPFWLPTQEIPRRDRPGRPRHGRPPKPPRSPAVGLVGLVLLALLATFFAWVSAEPLWLAVGHGDSGTATVSECTGSGVGQRCVGEFSAASGAFTAEGVRLVGVARDQSAVGSTVTARMVGADSGRAYVGDTAAVRHLRWALGLILVVLCGLGLVWVTGARRLEDRWSRRTATLTALTAPLLVTVAFLAATF